MPRYQKHGKHVEEVVLSVAKKTVKRSEGRAGGKYKERTSTYASEYMAESRMRSAIAGLKKRGFAHVSTLLMPVENLELEQPIFDDPADDNARIVYGDWLQERDDPRGALIAIQQQLRTATGAAATKLRSRERALLAEHSSVLFGAFDEFMHTKHERPTFRVEWKLGFFDEVEVRLSEGGMPDYPKLSEAVAMLAKLHSARFVRRLVLGGSAANYVPALAELVKTGWPRTLRAFTITGQLWGEYTPVPHALGALEPFYRAHPDLEELTLYLDVQSPGVIDLPRLRHLALWTNQLGANQLAPLREAKLPALRSFELEVGSHHKGVTPAEVAAVFLKFPALEAIALGRLPNVAFAVDLATRLASPPKLSRIAVTNSELEIAAAVEAATGRSIERRDRET